MYRKRQFARLLFILLLFPEIAHVSMTRPVDVTLDELIQNSSHIVVAEPDIPHRKQEEVPVVHKGRVYESYRRWVARYRVLESLRGDLKKDERIEVQSANDSTFEHMHRLFVIEGIRKSHYDKIYKPQASSEPGKPYILFLWKGAVRFSYVATQGVEGIGARSDIERRLGQQPDK